MNIIFVNCFHSYCVTLVKIQYGAVSGIAIVTRRIFVGGNDIVVVMIKFDVCFL